MFETCEILSEEILKKPESCRVVVEHLKWAMGALETGEVKSPKRQLIETGDRTNPRQLLNSLAYSEEKEVALMKLTTLTPENPKQGRVLINGIACLMDLSTGQPSLLVDGGHITGLRTGAMAALATQYLARNPKTVCVIGCGVQAEWVIRAILATHQTVQNIHLYSRSLSSAQALKDKLQAEHGVLFTVFQNIEQVSDNADVVCTTTSHQGQNPVMTEECALEGNALHIAIGGVDEETFEYPPRALTSMQVFVETVGQACDEAGEIRYALKENYVDLQRLIPLSKVVSGASKPDLSGPRFFRCVGHPCEDLAAACGLSSIKNK